MADIPAKAVRVDKIFRAACELPGCEKWCGAEHPDYAGANADRQAHLAWHQHGNGENDGGEWSA